MAWNFEKVSQDGSPGASAYLNMLAATSPPPEKLARESIQNSRDARSSEDAQITVRFRCTAIAGTEKQSLLDSIGLDLTNPHASLQDFYRRHTQSESALTEPLSLTYCEDFGTKGLQGDPMSVEPSPWRTYLHSTGETSKDTGGGSFGFGKSVFPALSRIHTIVVYTVAENAEPRLIALTVQKQFNVDGWPHGPRGWLSRQEAGWHVPITGEAAVKLAEDLAFVRKRDEYGLSVLMIDTDISPRDLIRGVEKHWWPALEMGKLIVDVETEIGEHLHPKPRSRHDLLPYVSAFRIASKMTDPGPELQYVHGFTRLKVDGNVVIQKWGQLAAIAKVDAEPDRSEDEVPPCGVALIRDSLMVVEYMNALPRSSINFYAAFVADASVCEFFRMAEPPAHDKWVADDRLDDTSNPPYARTLVARYKSEVRQRLQLWFKELKPSPPPATNHIPILDDVMARFLSARKTGKPTMPTQPPRPIHFSMKDEELLTADRKSQWVEATISVDQGCPLEQLVVTCRPSCHALLDRTLNRDQDEIGLESIDFDPPDLVTVVDGIYSIGLRKGDEIRITALSKSFDRRFFAELALNLEVEI